MDKSASAPGEASDSAPPPIVSPAVLRWVLPVTILGSSMGFIDGSVVNVALPAMQSSLQSNLATMQWVVNGYMLTLASLILLGGSLGDRYGRRRIFILGLILFAAASFWCGMAPSAGMLVWARLAQGAGAALLMPTSLAIIGAAYPEAERDRAIGIWAASAGLLTALGPPLGGWLVDVIGWRSIFFINPPIALLALVLALKLPADRRPEKPKRLDWAGSALAVLTLGLFSYGLVALGDGSAATGLATLGASIVAGILFLVVESRSKAPIMPLSLFKNPNFSGANAVTVLLYAALSGALFILPFLLVKVHGYSATAAGAALLPFSVIIGLGSRWAGGLSGKLGKRTPLIAGPALAATGFGILALTGHIESYWIGAFPGLLLSGLGMTISIPPLTAAIFDGTPEEASGTSSGINNAAARGGGLLAVAAIGLAFGGADLTEIDAASLQSAYAIVMAGAAVLALLSAGCAAISISPVRKAG
ncbi:MFS transporter [Rhizobium sp. TH2]|uniref:MFS transporter n=1 Tax=Rhizobium sp. TH2 TaxID=2775403 RepID=UPI0021583B54|nr:MFS transporter [Rhizobium sp. TH2]UVC11692.1 MFS transporter [Rhizobium sp. TH2]